MQEAKHSWTSWLDAALTALYPPQCSLCGKMGPAPICSVCRSEMEPYGEPLQAPLGPLEGWGAAFRYTGRAAQAVQRLKYARATSLAGPLATDLASAVSGFGLDGVDAIVPVPIHWRRRFLRGFNQAELLCTGFDPTRLRPEWLVRARATTPQASLHGAARLANLADAFVASPEVQGLTLLLVDDVRTSGRTFEACALALKAAGAQSVFGVAVAGGA